VDFSKPVTTETIIVAIAFIFVLVAIGLAIVRYYKKRV
jgi:ABC-type polysaccharide/polyol phosphate export permease